MPITILFSGGGSLGHVVPSLAVAEELRKRRPDCRVVFVCANRGNEKELLVRAGEAFRPLHAPKSPRGLSPSLLLFPFSFLCACFEAAGILSREKPQLIFSKGGFVSVPVCIAAWLRSIPIVLHESDSVMSLSSRLIARMAVIVCTGFPDVPVSPSISHKVHVTGNPVRSGVLRGSEDAAKRITGFSGRRPVVLIIGGSQGSVALNQAVEMSLQQLINVADVIHLTGVGKGTGASHARYIAWPITVDELPDFYALSDIVISRAGAGVLSELAALKKPVIVVPLAGVAHDHQVRNAAVVSEKSAGILLRQEELGRLVDVVKTLVVDEPKRRALGENLALLFPAGAADRIVDILLAAITGDLLQS